MYHSYLRGLCEMISNINFGHNIMKTIKTVNMSTLWPTNIQSSSSSSCGLTHVVVYDLLGWLTKLLVIIIICIYMPK